MDGTYVCKWHARVINALERQADLTQGFGLGDIDASHDVYVVRRERLRSQLRSCQCLQGTIPTTRPPPHSRDMIRKVSAAMRKPCQRQPQELQLHISKMRTADGNQGQTHATGSSTDAIATLAKQRQDHLFPESAPRTQNDDLEELCRSMVHSCGCSIKRHANAQRMAMQSYTFTRNSI